MKKIAGGVLATVAPAAALVGVAPPAQAAHDSGREYAVGHHTWRRTFEQVGECDYGNKSGPYVIAWQSILWAGNYLGGTGDIDGRWGPQTRAATKSYQKDHGISQTGCVATQTWRNAQEGGHGPDYPHITWKTVNGQEHHFWSDSMHRERKAEFTYGSNCQRWHIVQPGTGGKSHRLTTGNGCNGYGPPR